MKQWILTYGAGSRQILADDGPSSTVADQNTPGDDLTFCQHFGRLTILMGRLDSEVIVVSLLICKQYGMHEWYAFTLGKGCRRLLLLFAVIGYILSAPICLDLTT